MKTSDKGLAEIAGHEGIVQMPYKDSVGVWTYGVGHTKYAGKPDPATLPKGVAQPMKDVMAQFQRDIAKYEKDVSKAVKVPLKQHEFDALVSFHFNTGGIGRASLVQYLNAGDRAAAANAFMNWNKPSEIIPRRRAEMNLFKTGIYGDGKATVYPASEAGHVLWSRGTRVKVLDFIDPRSSGEPIKTDTLADYQERLKTLGYDPGPIDGLWGRMTSKAVRAFQKDQDGELVADGILGPLTSAAIDLAVSRLPSRLSAGGAATGGAVASAAYISGFTMPQIIVLGLAGACIYLVWRYREEIKGKILSWIG